MRILCKEFGLFSYLFIVSLLTIEAQKVTYDKTYDDDLTITNDNRSEFKSYDNVKVSGSLSLEKKVDDYGGKYLYINENLIAKKEFEIGTSSNGSTVIVEGYVYAKKAITLLGDSYLIVGLENDTSSFYAKNDLIINGTSVVEIWGDFEIDQELQVATDATLIIHGDLVSNGSGNNYFYGNIIVTGDADINKAEMSTSGNLVVGGDLTITQGTSDLSGNIYSIGDGEVNLPDGFEGKEIGGMDDLTEELLELLEKYGIVNTNTWTGENSTDWNDEENWNKGVPGSYTNVSVPNVGEKNYPVISGHTVVKSIEIESGANLTIAAGSYVTINGDLTTNGGFIVNNTQDEIASVIVKGKSEGEVTENWDLDHDRWWYISHPVSGDLIADYKSSLSSGNYYLYLYDNSSFSWTKITGYNNYNFSAKQAIALGILNDGYVLNYSGSLNNNDSYIYTAEKTGYQNIGNPYPSYIDFNSICTSQNSTITQTEDDNYAAYTGYTSYIYTTYEGVRQYATYNTSAGYGLNGGSHYIAPGQCFWVYAAAGEKVEITKDACTNSPTGSVSLKSTSSADRHAIIKLALSNSNTYDEVLIIGDEDNGSEEITKYDSKKRKNSGKIGNIFTIKNSVDVAINSLPEFYDGEIIPLGYSVSSSGMTDFTISVSDLENVYNYEIYLDDLDEGTSIELTEATEFTFTPTAASSDDRFQLRMASTETGSDEEDTTTGIETTDNDEITVYSSGNTAYVNISDAWLQSSDRRIDVYNVAGHLLQQVELNDLETSFGLADTGVYIIKVVSGTKMYQQKVLIKE